MCGIAGLFLKDRNLEPDLGGMLEAMTATLCSRGPDSAGFAIYGAGTPGFSKITLRVDVDNAEAVASFIAALGIPAQCIARDTHLVVTVPTTDVAWLRATLTEQLPGVTVVSEGQRLELYKEVGYPTDVAKRFGIGTMSGTHGISHTRMATESAVTTDGAHPFTTGADQCLVHNGSISNHSSLRRELRQDGIEIRTQNDSEVAAGYLTRAMRDGKTLGQALEASLSDLDGFYTFVVGTESGFGVLRDPIACKPAVMAETERYVAFASEYKSLTRLPGIAAARVWEPKPATVYFWER
ncbi:MAG: glutamine amidotransferase family protein [Acidocella sp.]|nr:glutamine amidotransferase family protein [Acidocella sp.]